MKRLSFAFIAALVTNASADNPSASLFSMPSLLLTTDCTMNDAVVLRELYDSTQGDDWTIGDEWFTDPFCRFCDWEEVKCNGNERVTGLELGKQIFN